MAAMTRFALIVGAAVVLAACAGQKEPAQKLLLETDATLIAASAEARIYVPQQLADVRRQYADLQAAFDKQDYAGVLSAAPAVLGAAQTLATAAAARKDEVLKVLNDVWVGLAAVLPDPAGREGTAPGDADEADQPVRGGRGGRAASAPPTGHRPSGSPRCRGCH